MPEWSVYLLRCADDSLYTGIATDVDRRIREHGSGKCGAKRLRGRGPLTLAFEHVVGDRAAASRVEHHIKQLAKLDKERLVASPDAFRAYLADLSRSQSQDVAADPAPSHDSQRRRVSSSAGK